MKKKNTVESIKSEFMNLLKSKNVDEAKGLLVKAQKEIAAAIGRDSKEFKEKFQKQKTHVEVMVAKALKKEIIRAERFLEKNKKELARLEAKIDASTKRKTKKKKSRKASSRKKVEKPVI